MYHEAFFKYSRKNCWQSLFSYQHCWNMTFSWSYTTILSLRQGQTSTTEPTGALFGGIDHQRSTFTCREDFNKGASLKQDPNLITPTTGCKAWTCQIICKEWKWNTRSLNLELTWGQNLTHVSSHWANSPRRNSSFFTSLPPLHHRQHTVSRENSNFITHHSEIKRSAKKKVNYIDIHF